MNYNGMSYSNNNNNKTNNQMPALPTGPPTGPSPTPIYQMPVTPVAPPGEQAPQTLQSPIYTPGYLRTQIGQDMRVEFLVGSSGPLTDRIGTLLSVGASYILLRPIGTDDTLLCDIYSIKFVTIYDKPVCTNVVSTRDMR